MKFFHVYLAYFVMQVLALVSGKLFWLSESKIGGRHSVYFLLWSMIVLF